ncbi:MAG TPA: sugar ABC transporter permease [Pseudonocardia sp.]|uniref:carbohydrate ABC transporter permease n=1 Tax=Pseudonocardia sp. TaxID=60912 RepID=UPI002B4AFF7D|nr:sugar ABC transporter permease [Pseudonocardia sp.]HLU54732.1 sugar ABC transporter permease [Pseudonocardia sp.]
MTVIEADAVRERPRTPAPAPRPQRAAGAGADGLFLLPAVLFVAVTVVYPLVYSVLQAFQDVGLREVIRGGADWVGLANFADQFGRPEFWQALWLSLVYTVGTVALSYAGGLALALLFLREFPGRNLMRALLLLAWILPTVVGANLWRWMLDGSYGLLNAALRGLGLIEGDVFWLGQPGSALFSVVLATAWSFAPFAMILLVAGLQSVPAVLYEAARIDGASAWQQFRHITLPALRPVSITVMLLIFIFAFKTFDTIYLMTRGGPGGATLTLPLYAFQEAFEFRRYDTAAVATTVMLVVPLVLSIFYFRSLRREEAA